MAKQTVVIIDYGSGNLRSAAKAFEHVTAIDGLEVEIKISARPEDVLVASRLVLPGQGAFGDCIRNLRAVPGMIAALEESALKKGTPFLGICVGMQLLATRGLEHGEHTGLNWIAGDVVPLAEKISDKALKIPHMGWNEAIVPQHPDRHFVLRSAENFARKPEHYYFVHSFVFECKDTHHILAQVDYGGLLCAAVGRDNIMGVQFHPEKSQDAGLKLIRDFLLWTP